MAISKELAKSVAVTALKNSMGDDLERARAAFRGRSAEELGRQYGQSGKTCQEILNEYEADRVLRTEALAWLEAQ